MEILERPNGISAGFAPLDNIGYTTFEVNLDGEVYKYGILDKAERVGSNKWKIRKYDFSGNPIECVIPRDMLVGFAWYNINESLWENSTYADTIRRCKEFFSISNLDKAKTIYQTSRGFYYYVTRFGEVYNTETMTKVKGCVGSNGYRYLNLGSVHHVNFHVNFHRLVANHFVRVPEDLLAKGLTEETLVVNHLDGNKLNNRCDNLEWTTIKGNLEHASINGLMHTTIDDHLLERVFKRLQEGYSDTNISRETGISVYTVNDIRRGKSPRYRTDKYTWPKHSPGVRVLDKATIFSIYDEFTYTDNSNIELSRKYNVSRYFIYALRVGRSHSNLAREYINSKGLDGYWKGYNPPK